MDIGSILLVLALLILVGLFIARPLFNRRAVIVDGYSGKEDHRLSALLAERDQVLNALQELDFDYSLGKIPEEDYPAQREAMVRHGAEVLRLLDEYQGPDHSAEDERLEAVIAARREEVFRSGQTPILASASIGGEDDEIEARLASRRRERAGKSAGFCPQCGRPVQKSDQYCPSCGSALA